MPLQIQTIGKYIHPQSGTQITDFFGIGLNLSGLTRSESYFPDGRMRGQFDGEGQEALPSLSLSLPGSRLRFVYNAHRENWIIFLKEPCPFFYDAEKQQVMYRDGDWIFAIAHTVALSREEAADVRQTFQQVRSCLANGMPQEQIRAEVLTMGLLLRFFCGLPDTKTPEHPAVEVFREKMERDVRWEKSLDELAAEVGFGRDHLRHLFIRKYGIPPGEYRIRQRIAHVMQLLSDTELSMKEIAERVGIPHVSYLNILVRKHCHTTPGALRRKFRSR